MPGKLVLGVVAEFTRESKCERCFGGNHHLIVVVWSIDEGEYICPMCSVFGLDDEEVQTLIKNGFRMTDHHKEDEGYEVKNSAFKVRHWLLSGKREVLQIRQTGTWSILTTWHWEKESRSRIWHSFCSAFLNGMRVETWEVQFIAIKIVLYKMWQIIMHLKLQIGICKYSYWPIAFFTCNILTLDLLKMMAGMDQKSYLYENVPKREEKGF